MVTGSAGFIGRRVVERLAQTGPVLAVDRVSEPEGWAGDVVEYRHLELDRELPNVAGAWILVHLAWNMDRRSPEAQDASLRTFERLLGQPGLTGVVGLGTAEEYGELEGRLSEASAPGKSLSFYGKAKHTACRNLQKWVGRASSRKAVWLRPFVVYGPGQRGDMAIPYALHCARERQTAEFSSGEQFRDFVHVDDVAKGVERAVASLSALKSGFTVCNLGRGQPIRLRDVLERIARGLNAQDYFKFGVRPMRAGEPREQFADVSSAAQYLQWRAQISWEEGIDALCKRPDTT